MPMVEGIGDEVIQVIGICLVILIFVSAWKSTAIREIPQIRAVFIVDRRSQTVLSTDANSAQPPPAPPDPEQSSRSNSSPNENINQTAESSSSGSSNRNQCNKPTTSANDINPFRFSYFTSLHSNQTPSTSTSVPSEASNSTVPNHAGDTAENEESEHSIRVKLKYLNDEQRIVRGNRKELLGQFKRRYFQLELDNNKNVLLIFQGRVLKEEETLETIGMYDNCVVHCLVKSGRTPEADSGMGGGANFNGPPDWNLGSTLVTTLGSFFTISWTAYWTYPHLFGITSTIMLACLTSIYVLAVASMYYPQLFQSL